jgi:hypothetical protein
VASYSRLGNARNNFPQNFSAQLNAVRISNLEVITLFDKRSYEITFYEERNFQNIPLYDKPVDI